MNKAIKVLHLFGTYLPNTENWAYNLIANTPDTQIFIAARRYIPNNFFNENFTLYQHDFARLEDHYVKLNKKHPIQLLEKIHLRLFKYPKQLLKGVEDFAKVNDIDIIHVHFANIAWFYLPLAQKLNKPFVISFYGWDYEKLPYLHPEYKQRFKTLFAQAATIICEGPHGAKILESYGCPKDKIRIVNLGVIPEKIPFTKRIKNTNELHLIQLATFTEKKGHHYTIRAFHHALKNCPNMHLTLVGSARNENIKAAVQQYISKHNLQDKVTILAAIDYHKLYDFLVDYQVFIQPSCYSTEMDCEGGAPIALLDAQATGMPIIATTHCDIPMEVINNKTGLLSVEKDLESLTANIKRFYEMDQSTYSHFAEAARNHVEDKFNIKNNGQKLSAIYASITS